MSLILVIDDQYDLREGICDFLQLEGFITQEAPDGQEALNILHSSEILPDLNLSDIMMPRLNGFELLCQMRKDLDTANIPFIFMSASHSKEKRQKALCLGADAFINKPFDLNELLTNIKNLL